MAAERLAVFISFHSCVPGRNGEDGAQVPRIWFPQVLHAASEIFVGMSGVVNTYQWSKKTLAGMTRRRGFGRQLSAVYHPCHCDVTILRFRTGG
ncbi:hypothetical protein Zmor_001410 [Zophobas morio]|uniref:Uncharacterized protein n=1 Tax=Zophobas morio TaxID=2755281 RepID=A0AA38MSM0_9CUCU|nr:hypothetical protein Zmor_001410 [Zophobas morio]